MIEKGGWRGSKKEMSIVVEVHTEIPEVHINSRSIPKRFEQPDQSLILLVRLTYPGAFRRSKTTSHTCEVMVEPMYGSTSNNIAWLCNL